MAFYSPPLRKQIGGTFSVYRLYFLFLCLLSLISFSNRQSMRYSSFVLILPKRFVFLIRFASSFDNIIIKPYIVGNQPKLSSILAIKKPGKGYFYFTLISYKKGTSQQLIPFHLQRVNQFLKSFLENLTSQQIHSRQFSYIPYMYFLHIAICLPLLAVVTRQHKYPE